MNDRKWSVKINFVVQFFHNLIYSTYLNNCLKFCECSKICQIFIDIFHILIKFYIILYNFTKYRKYLEQSQVLMKTNIGVIQSKRKLYFKLNGGCAVLWPKLF